MSLLFTSEEGLVFHHCLLIPPPPSPPVTWLFASPAWLPACVHIGLDYAPVHNLTLQHYTGQYITLESLKPLAAVELGLYLNLPNLFI